MNEYEDVHPVRLSAKKAFQSYGNTGHTGIVCPIDTNPECWLCWTAASLTASKSGLQQLVTPNPNNLPKLPLKPPQPRLAGLVALGLGTHGAAKPLCWLAKALWD